LDPHHLQELALSTRKATHPHISPNIDCNILTPPRVGAFNIVYEVSFSDGVRWAIRIPAKGDVSSPATARSMHLDIVAQRLISSKTAIPLPCIHCYSLDSNNKIGRPFTIVDFLPGTNLSKLWNDRDWR